MSGQEKDLMALQALLQIRSNASSSSSTADAPAASSNAASNHLTIPVRNPLIADSNLLRLNPAGFFPPSTQVAALQAAAAAAQIRANITTALSATPTGAVGADSSLAYTGLFPVHRSQLAAASSGVGKSKSGEGISQQSHKKQLSPQLTSQRSPQLTSQRSPQLTSQLSPQLTSQLSPQFREPAAGAKKHPSEREDSNLAKVAQSVNDTSSVNVIDKKKTDDELTEVEGEGVVRKDEVEAALRSKPQRGRKRDNLNSLERLELTRTRNREHARSTRVRKKQRYQELVDCEEKLLHMQKAEELTSKRITCVVDYIRARETMLRNILDKAAPLQCSGGESTKDDDSDEEDEREEIGHKFDVGPEKHHEEPDEDYPQKSPRFVSFDDLSDQGKTPDEKFTAALKHCVANCAEFGFDVVGHQVDQMELSGQTAIARMNSFDAKVCGFVYRNYGQEGVRRLRYEIVGSDNGIAINEDGVGFAKINLVVDNLKLRRDEANGDKTEEDDEPNAHRSNVVSVLSAIASLRFVRNSDKLRSVEFCVMKNFINALAMTSAQGAVVNVSSSHGNLKSRLQPHFFSGTDDAMPVRF